MYYVSQTQNGCYCKFILIVYRSDIFSKYLSLHRDKPKVDNPIKLLE